MKKIATYAFSIWARGLFLIYILGLSACTLPRPVGAPAVYDFGPGALHTPPATRIANLPPLEVSTPQASMALNSTAVLYRLGYADAQQLKPYALARWSMPPAQLIGQRLRSQLGLQRAVVSPGEITVARPARANASAPATAQVTVYTPSVLNLHLELEEFSQLFEAPDKSSGVVRLRATLTQRGAAGETLLAQRSFIVQQPAPSPDAGGAVRALTAATDQAIQEIEVWLGEVGRAGKAP